MTENEFGAGVSALFNAFRYLFALLGIVIVILIIWYFTFGGSFTVEQDERVLVMNFGLLEEESYGPGWHWNWPYPVSEIVRIPGPKKIQTLTTESFWFYMKPGQKLPGADNLTPGKDGYLLTGDANIIHGSWMIYYYIEDSLQYFNSTLLPDDPKGGDHVLHHSETNAALGTRGPKTLLQATLDNTIIKICAGHEIDYAWKGADFHTVVKEKVKAAVKKLNIGVAVDDVAFIQRTTPPMAALESFSAVTKAKVESATEKQKAENYAIKQQNEAESESAKIIAEANTYAIDVVNSIKAQAMSFKDILKEYRENPDTMPVALYSDTLSEVITSADDIFILRANEKGNQEIRILLNREPEREK